MTSRLDRLRSLRDRLDAEIAAEEAAQERAEQIRRAMHLVEPKPPATIVANIAALLGLTSAEIYGPGRHTEVAEARQAAMWALRQTGLSYPKIGRVLDRDHTTAMYGVKRVENSPYLRRIAEQALGTKGAA